MALYDYACAGCGPFDVDRPMGTAASSERCPHCGREAARRFSPPAVGIGRGPVRTAYETAAASAHQPAIVGRPPPAPPRTPVTRNPLHAALPRP